MSMFEFWREVWWEPSANPSANPSFPSAREAIGKRRLPQFQDFSASPVAVAPAKFFIVVIVLIVSKFEKDDCEIKKEQVWFEWSRRIKE